jgi:lysophospholipase L1-like esterase
VSVSFSAFGDSITTTYLPFSTVNGSTAAALEAINCVSWVPYAASVGSVFVGGFCRGGNKATQIAAATTPILSSVTVVMAGTNDMGPAPWGTPLQSAVGAVRDIIVASKAQRAIVCAIAPRQGLEAQRTLEYNAALHTFAVAMGWTWADPWVAFRAADGQWAAPAMTRDGVHPTAATSRAVGVELGLLIATLTTP